MLRLLLLIERIDFVQQCDEELIVQLDVGWAEKTSRFEIEFGFGPFLAKPELEIVQVDGLLGTQSGHQTLFAFVENGVRVGGGVGCGGGGRRGRRWWWHRWHCCVLTAVACLVAVLGCSPIVDDSVFLFGCP